MTWTEFLRSHAAVACDFCTVYTATPNKLNAVAPSSSCHAKIGCHFVNR